MRRALVSFALAASVCAATIVLPSVAAHAIDPPTVRITPGTSSVVVGSTRALTATVTNLVNTGVTWTMRSGSGTGSVSSSGVYTPPAQVPPTPVAVVRASSVEDSGIYGEATITIASGVAAGGFGTGVNVPGGSTDVETGDINGDGVADIVRLQNMFNSLQLFRLRTMIADGAGGFTTADSPLASLNQPFGPGVNDFMGDLALGDVDEDGDLDAIVATEWFDPVSAPAPPSYVIYRNDGTGAFTPELIRGASSTRSGARLKLTDFDGDGHLDAVRVDRFGTVVLQRGDGIGHLGAPAVLFNTFDGRSLAVGDLTGDGRPDVAVGTQSSVCCIETAFDIGINNGFGAISNKTTYSAGLDPEVTIADSSGDGWNDVLVATGRPGGPYTEKLSAFTNLAAGNGALSTTPTDIFAFRPSDLQAAQVDGDGVPDLVGLTANGPFLARSTGANAFSARHSFSTFPSHLAVGDVTGDGRVDVLATSESVSRFWPGSTDTTFDFAIDPTVTRVDATLSVAFTATARNSPVPVDVHWAATRGTWGYANPNIYTAPSSAAPTGTSVRIDAHLPGTAEVASREITVVNEKFQLTSLGGQDVRDVVADPLQANVLYAATATGVYRSTTSGASFAPLGTTGTTGTNAQHIAIVRDGSTAVVVATFGTGAFRFDLSALGADWVDSDGASFTATGPIFAVPGTQIVRAVGGGQVWQSPDAGATWTALGGTSVTDIAPIGATSFWAVRSVAPRVMTAVVDGSPAATYTARELPDGAGDITSFAADPSSPGRAFVATSESRMFRGTASGGAWTSLPLTSLIDHISVAPTTGALLATNGPSFLVFKSVDSGASWYSVSRGFASQPESLGHRSDGLELVGTSNGLYTPVSSTPPATPVVTGGPDGTSGPGTTNSFTFTFTPTPGAASHLCALDGTGWTACTSPISFSGPLSSGDHSFSVIAVDANGNDSAPALRTWTVDATPPPVPTIDAGPSGLDNHRDVSFTFSLTGDATGSTCQMDSGTATTCVSGVPYTNLTDGSHTFSVRAVDASGNISAVATRTWTIDATPPPYPYFSYFPGAWTTSTAAQFGWSPDNSATYACTLDAVAVPCADGSLDSVVGEGSHAFTVVATDAAGNSISHDFTWTVDLTPPAAPVISHAPPAVTSATSASFDFASTSSDVQYYMCDLDGIGATYCFTAEYTGLAAGQHTFTVYTVDQANQASASTTYTWTVSSVPPPDSPTMTGGPTGLVNTRTATFTFSVGPDQTAKCSVDGAAPPVTCTSGVTYSDLVDGSHTVDVYAVSDTGLVSAATRRSWTVDATPPTATTLLAAPPVRTKSQSAAFDWTPVAGVTYTCALDSGAATCGGDGSYAVSGLSEGLHHFVVTATDGAGNAMPKAHDWTVDLTGPTVNLTASPPALGNSTAATFAFSSAAGDLDHFSCTVDGVSATCVTGFSRSSLTSGSHTFSVVAVDDVGNAGPPAAWTWTVDTTAPVATVSVPPAVLNPGLSTSFSEAVTGVSTRTLNVRLAGTTTVVPSTVACRDGANVTVACTTRTVRRAVLTPTSPLIAGQRYTVQTLAGIADLAGNAAPAASQAFRASISEQETSLGAKPGWRKVPWAGAKGGSYTIAHLKGQTASYVFNGTAVTWFGIRGPSYGRADIYVDNVRKATVSFYSTSAGSLATSVGGLSNAKHTLRIVVRGEKGATKGTGTNIALDAIKVGTATAVTPAASYGWAPAAASAASGGAYAFEDSAGATYTFSFRGRGVDWITVLGQSMGKATVQIDGVTKGTFDNYAAASRYGVRRSFTGLVDKTHTMTITVLRQRRVVAADYRIAVDGFSVRP